MAYSEIMSSQSRMCHSIHTTSIIPVRAQPEDDVPCMQNRQVPGIVEYAENTQPRHKHVHATHQNTHDKKQNQAVDDIQLID